MKELIGLLLFIVFATIVAAIGEGFCDARKIKKGRNIRHKESFLLRIVAGLTLVFTLKLFTTLTWWFCGSYFILIGFVYWIAFEIVLNLRIGQAIFYRGNSKIDRAFKDGQTKLFYKLIGLVFFSATSISLF